jgi:hypothetical protein
MDQYDLGPNGGLVYCIEYLAANLDWLRDKMRALGGVYVVLDCPGQVELYTHHAGMRKIVQSIVKWGYQLCVVNLVDSHHCSDPAKFVSVLLVCLASMCHLELPHVNILSKIDIIEQCGPLAFGLEFFTDVLDLQYLLELLDSDPFSGRYIALNRAICEMVETYNQVAFSTLNILDKHSVDKVLKVVDRANGYVFGDLERRNRSEDLLYNLGNKGESESDYSRTMEVQEKYMREFAPNQSFRPSLPDDSKIVLPVPISAPTEGPATTQKVCWSCMKAAGPFRCGSCKQAYYCSRECQRTHWQQHKPRCITSVK